MSLRHRLYVVPVRADVAAPGATRHWRTHHARLFARTPGLVGYVQNRPAPLDRHGDHVVCSETWFADRHDERAAFTGAFYLGPVAEDEASFVDRDRAWTAVVRTEVPVPTVAPPFRGLVLGWRGATTPTPDATVWTLDRPGPDGGPPRVLVVEAATRAGVRRALEEPGDRVLVTRPAVVVSGGAAVSAGS